MFIMLFCLVDTDKRIRVNTFNSSDSIYLILVLDGWDEWGSEFTLRKRCFCDKLRPIMSTREI